MELPKDCIADILCRTTPVDAARLSVISKIFCSVADSDTVWDRFLPSDYRSIVSQSPSLANAPSKKSLYLALSDHPIIIDQGKKSFQLDRKSGKKCYMLSAKALSITKVDRERYCHWITLPESRFEEVAKFKAASWFEIRGKINTVALSSNTQYTTFLVFKLIDACGFLYTPVELSVGTNGGLICSKMVFLDPKLKQRHLDNRFLGLECPHVRSDGFLEIEMWEFFNLGLDDHEVEMSVTKIESSWWQDGFYLEGIEVRPKISDSGRK